MPRRTPNALQNILSSLILPLLSVAFLPLSLSAVLVCLVNDKVFKWSEIRGDRGSEAGGQTMGRVGATGVGNGEKGCVIISGGRMSKGLM
jgi:hypothetical protein